MLRTNLSTRPFYNERIVHAVVAVFALILFAITAWQVARVIRLSQSKTEYNASIGRNKAEAERLTREAENIRRGLDQKQLAVVAAEAKEANLLIEQRTFSWTRLFNLLEANLPEDVMLTSVRPEFDKEGTTHIAMEIQGRGEGVIDNFWDRLEKTGAFHDIAWSDVTITEEGIHRVQMSAVYTGEPR